MAAFWQDTRYALRVLAKAPGFTAVAILTLALGIGASTALFSVINALVLRELPVSDPGRLVSFYTTRRNGHWGGITVLQLKELESHQKAFTGIFGRSYPDNSNVEDDGNIWPINLGKVTGQYYSVLGIKPVLGRLITPNDTGISHGTPSAVAVISYNFWQRRYRSRGDVLGKTILVAEKPFSIIGVTPKGFFGEQVGFALDVTIPITETPGAKVNFPHGAWCQYGVGRLRKGVSFDQARAELATIWPAVRAAAIPAGLTAAQLSEVEAEQLRTESYPKNGYSYFRDQFSEPLYVLMGISGLILLIACVNLAMLLLARSSARRHELAIRIALGASRWRVMRQQLTESLVISISGAVVGMGLATWASGWLVAFWRHIPFNPPTVIDLSPDFRVLFFAVVVAILTGVLFGLAPAWHGARAAPAMALQEASHGSRRNLRRVGRSLITLQVAICLALVAAGALLGRSLEKIRAVHPGFNYKEVAFMQLQGDAGGNENYGDTYYRNLVQQLSEVRGVDSVALSQMPPGAGFGGTWTVGRSKTGSGSGSAALIDADSQIVSPEFFSTLKIQFLHGRDFTWLDDELTPRVGIISQSLAQRLFPAGDSIGQFIRIRAETLLWDIQVVGVVKDARVKDIRSSSPFAVYVPFLQEPKYWTNVEMRMSGSAGQVLQSAEERAEALGKEYVFNSGTLEGVIDGAIANERAMALVSGFFSILALLIALVGLEGLMSYSVMQRTQEIGVRIALGARRADVLRMVLGECMLLALGGIALGVCGALLVGRLLQSFLFGLKPWDAVTLVGVSFLLALVALTACYVPARRAMSVEPIEALRYE